MSNFTIDGLRAALGSADAKICTNAQRVLVEWLRSLEVEKRDAASKFMAEGIERNAAQQDQTANNIRLGQVLEVFYRAHPELVKNVANERMLLSYIQTNFMGQVTLDNLEVSVEQLGDALSKQKVPEAPLTPEQKLEAKMRARRLHEKWLRTLSKEELEVQSKVEANALRHGHDLYGDLSLSPEEKEQVKKSQPVAESEARLWNPATNPRREFTKRELAALTAEQMRNLVYPVRDPFRAKEKRFNDIWSGAVQPAVEGQ